ncbi:MAG: hypothetical protein L3J04_10285 [Robiginitomaculum sp.]|nr:hypothetical protein [Robiginitomaculum sp.]
MKEMLEWQKAILAFSTIIVALMMPAMLVLFPLLGSNLNLEQPNMVEIIKLSFSGWIGFVVVGTIINLIISTIKFVVSIRNTFS